MTVSKSDRKLSPLHHACRHGHLEIVQYLTRQCNCDPNATDKEQWTPLHYACEHGHLDIVRYLLTEYECVRDIRNKYGRTPLHHACGSGHAETVQYLISEHSCNVEATDELLHTPLHYALRHRKLLECLLESRLCDPNILLEIALTCKSRDTAKIIISKGKCDLNKANKDGKTPLELASHPGVVRELICHGANPSDIYTTHNKVVRTKLPLQSPVKIFVTGNHGVGKSTLIAALQTEMKRRLSFGNSGKKLAESDVTKNTAGIIPYEFTSKTYGAVVLHDFAGHKEYYSSHATVLQNTIQSSPPIFIVVINLCNRDADNEREILYWLSFLENQCTFLDNKPHIIIVGSHEDCWNPKDRNQKIRAINALGNSQEFTSMEYKGFVEMNCQEYLSPKMEKLRQLLQKSCDSLRKQERISFNAHCFLVYLIDNFRNKTAVELKNIHASVTTERVNSKEDHPCFYLPENLENLYTICDELADQAHILFFKDTNKIENSWIVIDKDSFMININGTLFAQTGSNQHVRLVSNTGVVPLSKLENQFPKYKQLLPKFLSYLEYCHEISDKEILQQIIGDQSIERDERYFFFPALLEQNVSSQVWESKIQSACHFGWILISTRAEKFFTSRLLEVLLLRLAFSFALEVRCKMDTQPLERKCQIWKTGIRWGTRDGVDVLVKMVDANKAIVIRMQCSKLSPEYLQLRSAVIKKVKEVVHEFCPKMETQESLFNSLENVTEVTESKLTYNLEEVAATIIDGKGTVVHDDGHTIDLQVLLSFEPYACIGQNNLCRMFSPIKYNDNVEDLALPRDEAANSMMAKLLVNRSSPSFLNIFREWQHNCEGTYKCLRLQLDQYSVFTGPPKNALQEILSDQDFNELSTHSDHEIVHSIPQMGGTPSMKELLVLHTHDGTKVSVIKQVASEWENLATTLGLEYADISIIKRDHAHDAEGASRTVFSKWLNMKSVRTWARLIQCLNDTDFGVLGAKLEKIIGEGNLVS